MQRSTLCLCTMLTVAIARPADSQATVHTTVLPAAGGATTWEPTLAIDPSNPDRIIVGSMYDLAPRGFRIWMWRTGDGGKTWASGLLDPPRMPKVDIEPKWGADVVAGFAEDGTPVVTTMSGVDELGGDTVGTFVSRFPRSPVLLAPTSVAPVFLHSVDSAARRRVIYDKPWLVVDHQLRSSHRGTIYVSSAAMTTGMGIAGGGRAWTIYASRLVLAASRDGGRTFGAPVVVADSSFGGELAVGANGALETTYLHLIGGRTDGAGDAVLHRRSTDGGKSFGPPVSVATLKGDSILDLPSLGARPNGDLMACWSQWSRTDESHNQVRCATRTAGAAWSTPHGIDAALPPGTAAGWPAVVGTESGWYVMTYVTGRTRTEVVLLRSADGATFSNVATLAGAEGLGNDRFCLTAVSTCHRKEKGKFSIGEYVSLDARRGRIAAAYVLPRPDSVSTRARRGTPAVYVTTLAEPPR